MDFNLPEDLQYLEELDEFIEREIRPLEPFEHIYRHHRRYRVTEGAEEIRMRRVAGYMFGYTKQQAPKGVTETPVSGG